MLSEAGTTPAGVSRASLSALLAAGGEGAFSAASRYEALERFETLPIRSPLKSGRGWKRDPAKFDFSVIRPEIARATFSLGAAEAQRHGIVVMSLDDAFVHHADRVQARLGTSADLLTDKFAALAVAYARGGAHVYVPEGVRLDEPIRITYAGGAGSIFPYTLIVAGARAEFRVIQEFEEVADGQICCGIAEVIAGDASRVGLVSVQTESSGGMSFAFDGVRFGEGAEVNVGLAEIGSVYTRTRLVANLTGRGSTLELTALFFANGDQHADLSTSIVHAAGATTSHTIVRSAGIGKGQGRYVGDIKILPDAHGADASLRDDALLLSKDAHVDSVPALEIAANDVKAYHGATVGSISEEELFYTQTRGIERTDAERMIALGFFEPALARLPSEELRSRLRTALEAKLG